MQKKLSVFLLALCLFMGLCVFVTPRAQAAETDINLKYDDRKDLAQLLNVTVETVQISDQNVKSYQVGSTQADSAVILYDDGILYAVGTGTATLTVNDVAYKVTVTPAEISLFMYTGHSVGHGVCGTAAADCSCGSGTGLQRVL